MAIFGIDTGVGVGAMTTTTGGGAGVCGVARRAPIQPVENPARIRIGRPIAVARCTLYTYPPALLNWRPMVRIAALAGSVLVLFAAPASAKPSLFGPTSVVQTTCVACHNTDPDGAVTRIEGLRTTPEEWSLILDRMERRWGLQIDAKTHKQALKELSGTLFLTPEEAKKVAFLLRSPAASDKEKMPTIENGQRMCASCHTWGKTMSYRRTADSWASLLDFHTASFPISTILSYEDTVWQDRSAEVLKAVAPLLPFENVGWRKALGAKAPDLSGTWIVAGHYVGKFDYEGQMTLTHRGNGDYKATRVDTLPNGKQEELIGAGALYAGHSLRMRWTSKEGSKGDPKTGNGADKLRTEGDLSEAFELDPDGHLQGTWKVLRQEHEFGDEVAYRAKGPVAVLRVSPAWLSPGSTTKVRIFATGTPGKIDLGKGVRVTASRPLKAGWTELAIKVDPKAPVGVRAVLAGGKPTSAAFAIARRVDYITVSPIHGVARTGFNWDPKFPGRVPKQGVPFEAIGWSFGPDGKRETADDFSLGHLKDASWQMAEFMNTPDDEDIDWIGKLGTDGLFIPAEFEPNERAPQKNNTGNVWIVASYRPGPAAAALRARAYLWATFPDLVKGIR